MKTIKLTVLFLLITFSLSTQAQVAINKDGSTPATTSILHVKGDNSGTPVQAMFINSETGNVGIGTTTPGFPLTFKQIGGEKISFYGQSGNHYGIGIGINMLQIHGSSSNSIIAFGYGSSASFTELMRIKGNGQVGIGTTEPETNLNIYSNADNNGLTLQTSDNTFSQGIRFRNSGGAYTWNIYRKNAGSNHADLIFANGMSTDLSTFTEVVTFKDGGNVGIGTTAPSNELSVVGDADFSGDVGIGTSNPDASAALEVSSTTTGFLPPRLTQSQIEAIVNPATGLMVFNTDDERIYFYSDASASWLELALGTGTVLPPCGTDFIDSRDNQRYTTVLIGTQCWMSENLNYETSNSMCYDNNSTNCETYGRLYRGDVAETACPSGWHLPTDDEWKILEGNADTQYGVGDPVWDNTGYRGYNAGKRLKTTTGWDSNTGTDAVGFSAIPGGYYNYTTSQFIGKGLNGQWWTASPGTNNAYHRFIFKSYNDISRNSSTKVFYARSVRCVRD